MPGFENLEVWRKSVDLSAAVYQALRDCRDFTFKDQICRSALSMPSNIAEGMERESVADQARFLDYARGSSGEFRTQAIVGQKAFLLAPELAEVWIQESRGISAMIQGLIRSLGPRRPPKTAN